MDLIQPDVSKAGGLSETKRIVELAREHNVTLGAAQLEHRDKHGCLAATRRRVP